MVTCADLIHANTPSVIRITYAEASVQSSCELGHYIMHDTMRYLLPLACHQDRAATSRTIHHSHKGRCTGEKCAYSMPTLYNRFLA